MFESVYYMTPCINYLNVLSVKLFAYSQSFIFEMQVSSAPLAEFVSLLLVYDNKMTDIKLLFASKYYIYVCHLAKVNYILCHKFSYCRCCISAARYWAFSPPYYMKIRSQTRVLGYFELGVTVTPSHFIIRNN